MADILQFKTFKRSGDSHAQNVLKDTADLLTKYPMDQIILGLFQAANYANEIADIMPSFAKIVIDNEQK